MITALVIILALLWFLGYIHINGLTVPDLLLFSINGHPVTLWDILILLVLSAVVGMLPSPFRQVAGVFLVLWILAVLGILAFAGLSSLLVLAVIIGLIVYIVSGAVI